MAFAVRVFEVNGRPVQAATCARDAVAILEAGGRQVDADTQDLYAGKATLSTDGGTRRNIDDYLTQSRARFYGGSGNWWGGKCVPLDPADFAERSRSRIDGVRRL